MQILSATSFEYFGSTLPQKSPHSIGGMSDLLMSEKTKSRFGWEEQECRDHHTRQHQVLVVLC